MGAPAQGMKAAEQPAAETLLSAFRTIPATERRRHASVLNYWLSIRGDKEFPPLHDLDPLELSDAGPSSILFELISGGHDAEIRHMGETLRDGDWPERILDAESNSVLACIAKKLPIVAISRDFLSFEDEFASGGDKTRCWVTLLPLSAGGAWVDYVYALVSTDAAPAKTGAAAKKAKASDPEPEVAEDAPAEFDESVSETEEHEIEEPVAAVEEAAVEEATAQQAPVEEATVEDAPVEETGIDDPVEDSIEPNLPEVPIEASEDDADEDAASSAVAKAAPGFSKLLDSIAGLTGFYGSQPVKVEPVAPTEELPEEEPAVEDEPVADEQPEEQQVVAEEPDLAEETAEESSAELPAEEKPAPKPQPEKKPARAPEGTLQNKLTEVRAKADEARMAKLRANAALYEGLGAAYDFALDAEEAPEEYLRLVEAQGLKIQLRSPMKPVVKLAFDGMCDDATIKQLEAVLAWAFDQELPRGGLAKEIEAAGGIARVLGGEKKAA